PRPLTLIFGRFACFGFLGHGIAVLVGTRLGAGFAGILALVLPAPPPSATAPAAALVAAALAIAVAGLAILFAVEGLFLFVLVGWEIVFRVIGKGFEARNRRRARPGAGDTHLGAFFLALGEDFDGDAIALLDLGKIGALGVEQIHRRLGRGVERDDRALALGRFVLDQPQRGQAGAGGGADEAGAIAVRARAGGGFEHPGAQALAAHFHQPEARNAADLDARTIVLERFLHRLLDFADVRSVFHVDEVDDHQPGHVAQTKLAGDLARGFEIGVER